MLAALRFFVCIVMAMAFQSALATESSPGEDGRGGDAEMHRALGILNYIIGDYPLAVDAGGRIVSDSEYDEQATLLAQVHAILVEASGPRGVVSAADSRSVRTGGGLLDDVETLRRLIDEHSEPSLVVGAAKMLRDAIVHTYDLQLAPTKLPALTRGRELYASACAVCHGTVGQAGTPTAERLNPRPTNLLSRHLDQTLSPYQIFNVVTYGVAGTSMPEFSPLTAAERWDMAFYVSAMRQRAVPRNGTQQVDPTLEMMARSTDAELSDWLAEHGVPADQRASEVSRLRRGAPALTQ